MFLIMSATYIDKELQSEFGEIPPSFLPLENKRLFQHQVNLSNESESVYLTVPRTFKIPQRDLNWLKNNNVSIIYLSEDLTLGSSLVSALSLSAHEFSLPVRILFGDTLFTSKPMGEDIISVSTSKGNYSWATVSERNNVLCGVGESQGDNAIVNGYFCFSQPRELMRSMTQASFDFYSGLIEYNKKVKLSYIKSDDWLDFGHVNTYYNSKVNFTTQRAFNNLSINSNWVEKSSSKNNNKILAEANWFLNVPCELKKYTPLFLGEFVNESRNSYRLEYLYQTSLNELFIFSKLPLVAWDEVINKCLDFIYDCSEVVEGNNIRNDYISNLFNNKTVSRLNQFCAERGIDINQPWSYDGKEVDLATIINDSNEVISKMEIPENSVIHGDLCFSNILYDFRSNRIKVIDPRGIDNSDNITIYGNIIYDIAKLSHSIIGLYDWIISGYYDVRIENHEVEFKINHETYVTDIQERFIELVYDRFNIKSVELDAMQIHLFLSMLPLHYDNTTKQNALFANVFRLYYKSIGQYQ